MTPIDVILEAGAIATGTTIARLRSRARSDLMMSRRRAFIARKMHREGYSWQRIGREMGGRSHTTIIAIVGTTAALRTKGRKPR